MSGRIFITYNPNGHSQIEESTALRMQTLSNLYGIGVDLPYRLDGRNSIDDETVRRINNSDYIVAFSLEELSPRLKSELDYAIKINKPIVIIYDSQKGQNISYPKGINISEVFLDIYNPEDTIAKVAEYLHGQIYSKSPQTQVYTRDNPKITNGVGIALLAIGVGLLTAALISSNGKD
jgi:hypothetical protein